MIAQSWAFSFSSTTIVICHETFCCFSSTQLRATVCTNFSWSSCSSCLHFSFLSRWLSSKIFISTGKSWPDVRCIAYASGNKSIAWRTHESDYSCCRGFDTSCTHIYTHTYHLMSSTYIKSSHFGKLCKRAKLLANELESIEVFRVPVFFCLHMASSGSTRRQFMWAYEKWMNQSSIHRFELRTISTENWVVLMICSHFKVFVLSECKDESIFATLKFEVREMNFHS